MPSALAFEPAIRRCAAPQMITVHVRMPDGGWLSPRLACGARVLTALREFGIPLRSPNCNVRVAHGAQALNDLLAAPDLDGLELELTDDSLEPQTFWVAG